MSSAGAVPALSRPRIIASPMLPAPRNPTFLPFTLIFFLGGGSAPTRTSYLCSRAKDGSADADDGRAFLHGDLEVVAHPHREVLEPRLVPQLAEPAEPRPSLVSMLDRGRNRHEPPHAQRAQPPQRLHRSLQLIRGEAALGGLARQIDLDQDLHHLAGGRGPSVELARPLPPVHRVDQVEEE